MPTIDTLSPPRQSAIRDAADGCWPETEHLLAEIVEESRRAGAWRPARAALLMMLAGPGETHMTAEQFGVWKKQARNMAKIKGVAEKPVDDLGMAHFRYRELSSASRQKTKGIAISRPEALACAHYLLGFDKPCTPAELADWFYPRFVTFASVAPLLDMTTEAFGWRINGYRIEDGVKKTVVPEGYFIRALDWIWRFGILNPYGTRPAIAFYPDQPLIER